ncbi:MAG: hypothetical protein KatS3mg106_528 [Gemmataceae bacterium]|jgi:hypothetical protein|nr:MAG: hypothetical protein KatS3mg106_528 [Gemmataceae bacterium]
MSREVPYRKKEVIEAEAELVLAEYGQQHGPVTAPPIPIDEIVELHLKLTLEILDLQKIFGFGDVHGAIWFRSQRVGVDQSLDPARNTAERGRATISRWRTKRATGGSTGICSCSTRISHLCSRTRNRSPTMFAARARRKSLSNGRRISLPPTC